jgi:Family of unknown function (DUF5675)
MLRLTIDRGASTDQGTPGNAELNNAAGIQLWTAHSLELPWRNNASDVSCVPAGVYNASVVPSGRFPYPVYQLQNVPGRSACELHDGNVAGDTSKGFKSDVEGCTIFGTDVGQLQFPGYPLQYAVLHSDVARAALMAATGGSDIEVEYRWTPGNDPS